jgi:hypothetical protein
MKRFALAVLVLAFAGACRAGGGSAPSSPAASASALESSLQAFQAAFQAVSVGLTVAFTQGTDPGGEITDYKHTLLCETVGPENQGTSNIEARVSDDTLDGTFFITSNLKNCNDVDGDVDAVGRFQRATGQTVFQWDYTGKLHSAGCVVSLEALSVESVQGEAAASFVTGTLSADCEAATVSCDWNQTLVLDGAALLAACSCSGSGC